MRHRLALARRWVLIMGLALALLLGAAQAWAALGGYDLSRFVLGGGGGGSSGTGYSLSGTVGQPAAGTLTAGGYTLNGGFWTSAGPLGPAPGLQVFLPYVGR